MFDRNLAGIRSGRADVSARSADKGDAIKFIFNQTDAKNNEISAYHWQGILAFISK